MKKWAAFYVGEHMEICYVTDETHSPSDVPGDGVIAIAIADPQTGWYLDSSKDFYLYDEELFGGWCGVDHFGLTRALVHSAGRPIVLKLGTNIPNALWRRFKNEAARELPPKSAYRMGERR